MNYVCNLSIFICISPRDIVGINKLIVILKIISQTLCDAAEILLTGHQSVNQSVVSSYNAQHTIVWRHLAFLYIKMQTTKWSSWSCSYGSCSLPVKSMPITTQVVTLNPTHDQVYSIQHYVIKFVSDLWLLYGFLLNSGFLHQ